MGAASPNLYSLCRKTTRPCFLVFSKRTSIMSVLILIFSSIFFTSFKISLYSQYAINNNDINFSFCRVLIILYNGLRCALPESFVKIHCRWGWERRDIEYWKEINSALSISVSSHLTSQSGKNEQVWVFLFTYFSKEAMFVFLICPFTEYALIKPGYGPKVPFSRSFNDPCQ